MNHPRAPTTRPHPPRPQVKDSKKKDIYIPAARLNVTAVVDRNQVRGLRGTEMVRLTALALPLGGSPCMQAGSCATRAVYRCPLCSARAPMRSMSHPCWAVKGSSQHVVAPAYNPPPPASRPPPLQVLNPKDLPKASLACPAKVQPTTVYVAAPGQVTTTWAPYQYTVAPRGWAYRPNYYAPGYYYPGELVGGIAADLCPRDCNAPCRAQQRSRSYPARPTALPLLPRSLPTHPPFACPSLPIRPLRP
jgi:hypothetical protein